MLIETKIKVRLGELPEQGTDWWTEKQWEEHRKGVEELKAEGRYLKEEEITIWHDPKNFEKIFGKSTVQDKLGILVPPLSNYSFQIINLSE